MRLSTLLRSAEDKTVALAAKAKPAMHSAALSSKYHAARTRSAAASALRTIARKVDAANRVEG